MGVSACQRTAYPTGASAQARVRLVEQLRGRRSEIDAAIFARVSDQWFDRTGSGDAEYVAGLRTAGAAAPDYVLVGIERSGESLEPIPIAALVQARRAARAGVGLDTLMKATRTSISAAPTARSGNGSGKKPAPNGT